MREPLTFPVLSVPVDDLARRDVAVLGGDVAAVFIAAILARRGHRVVWYRGDLTNPHAGSGVIRDFASDPVALPGFVLGVPGLCLGNAVRGGLVPAANPLFLAWVLRAVAASRPLAVEEIASDRAWLLSAARPAFASLAAEVPFVFEETEVLTLYRDAGTYAAGWAAHDVRRRHGCVHRELSFADLAALRPHLSPRFGCGVRIAGVTRVAEAEAVVEALKDDLESRAEVARHWPERVRPRDGRRVEIMDGGKTRVFDWVVRCEDGGPESIWPRARGCLSACLPYRERCLVRKAAEDVFADAMGHGLLIDGGSGASLEYDRSRIVAGGAHRLGGAVEDDLRYLVAASYARIWRDLAGRGWRDEGGRVTVARGWVAPDSRPLLGDAGSRVLVSAGYGDLAWTLAAAAGFAIAAEVEENDVETAKLAAFSPRRFD